MVQVNRIGPDGGFLRDFVEFRDRVKSLETRPAGNIRIRETLTTEDPLTGVQTTIGQLPDGSYGFQPFIGDTEPPPVATTPTVASGPGVFVVSWDGAFVGSLPAPRDFEHVNVIGHKIVSGSDALTTTVGVIRLLTESLIVGTDVAAPGETWQFSLESEDFNGNRAALSLRSPVQTMKALSEDSSITDALAAVQADADAAQTAANNAQTSANTAQTAADQAKTDAANAAGIANGKGKVLTQSTAPATADQNANTLWIDTTSGANTPKRWDGSAWVAVTDKAATDAAAAAAAAQTKADQAFTNAASASTAAGNAQTSADSKNRIWYQNTAPAGTGHKANDSWFDTGNDNRLSKWNATNLTWDLSLIGNSAIFPNIDAGKMTVGTLDAARLAAKSISADKLVITSTDNLIMGADFTGSSWQISANNTINATAGRGSLPAMRITGTSSPVTSLNLVNRVPVGAEDRFRAGMWIKSNATAPSGVFQLKGRCYSTATAYTDIVIASNSAMASASTWTNISGISPVLPTGTLSMEFYLSVQNAATGTITDIDYVSVTRAFDGKLVVDGAIDGKTITGATIRTAASGARIILDQSSLKAWNDAGDNYFSVSNADGVNLSVAGQYGYTVLQSNFCTNPSFEVDLSGWTSAQTLSKDTFAIPSTEVAVPGSASLKASHTSAGDITVTRTQSLGGNVFGSATFSAYVMQTSGAARNIKIQFSWTDANGTPLPNETYSTTTSVQTNWWTRISVPTSANGSPLGAVNMSMSVTGVAFGATESLWVDAVLLDAGYYTTPRPYIDGDQPKVQSDSFVWLGTPGVSGSEKRRSKDVKIKTGINTVLINANAGGGVIRTEQSVAPSVAFLLPNPNVQPAGLFSDGVVVSLIEGTNSASDIAQINVGGGEVKSFSGTTTTLTSNGAMNLWSKNSTLFLQGTAVNINGVDMKTRRAEFNNSGSFSVNAGALWDIGALTLDTNTKKTVNGAFATASATPGAITISEEGYYMFFAIVIPNSNPGPAWLRLYRASDSERLFQVNNGNAYAWETAGSTIPVYISQGETVRTMYQATNAHTINAKLKVVKVNYC